MTILSSAPGPAVTSVRFCAVLSILLSALDEPCDAPDPELSELDEPVLTLLDFWNPGEDRESENPMERSLLLDRELLEWFESAVSSPGRRNPNSFLKWVSNLTVADSRTLPGGMLMDSLKLWV